MDEVVLAPYDAEWPGRFLSERAVLASVLPPDQVVAIEHAGSTAIPGLDAKPIIDIFVAVPDIEAARVAFPPILETIGYAFWAENPDRERLFFVKGLPPRAPARTHHVHAMETAAAAWQRALLFRDYLRAHAGEAQRYLHLKRDLARRHREDREAYTRAKDDYVADVVGRARSMQQDNRKPEEMT